MEGFPTIQESSQVPLILVENGDSAPGFCGKLFGKVKTFGTRYSKRQWTFLALCGLSNLLSSVTLALQAPFYPEEAEKKGASATEYGLVFGVFDFMVFVTAPLFGMNINRIGPKRLYTVCVIITSIAVLCFGVLDRVNDHNWFITLSLICRFVEGLGCGGFFPATFTLIATEFPNTVAETFSIIEVFIGLGLILGPTLGEALYTLGGFTLPFLVVGTVQFTAGLLSLLFMPTIEKTTGSDGTTEKGYGIFALLRIPSIAIISLSIMSTSISMEYLSAILEPHIRQFGLEPMQVGLVFVATGGMYAFWSPICGRICDKIERPMNVALVGNILTFIAYLLIGPASFMPFDTVLWASIVGLLIEGVGLACCVVSGFSVALKEAVKNGFPVSENGEPSISTNGAVSGLWQSMISLGAWVGPISAGILYDHVGFRRGSWLVLGCSFTVTVLIIILTIVEKRRFEKLRKCESQSLLTLSLQLKADSDGDDSTILKPVASYGSISEA